MMHEKTGHTAENTINKNVYEGFRDVFSLYHPSLVYFAQSLLKDQSAAEDIVGDVFLKLWEKEPDLSKYKNIKAVLFIAVKNSCLNHNRLNSRRSFLLSRLFGQADEISREDILSMVVQTEMVRKLYEEICKLPVERRTVIELFYMEGWNRDQIAAHLNISPHTVKKYKLKGIHMLREKLKTFPFLWLAVPFIVYLIRKVS